MNRPANQLKMGTLLSYVSIVIQNLVAIIYTPVMLRLLGQNEYGLYQLANSIIAYLGLLNFGFGSSYVRFFYQYKVKNDEDGIRKLNGIFLLVFGSMSLLCIAAGSGLVLSADTLFRQSLSAGEIHEVKILMAVLVVTMALTFPNIIFDCYITAHERYIFQRLLLIAVTVLNPFISLPLMLMGYRSKALVIASLFLTILRMLLNIYYSVKKLHMRFLFKKLEFKVFKSVGAFSFYIFLNEVVNQINWNVDKLILGAVQGAGVVAIYSVGSQFNQYFITMSASVSNVFIPRINKMVAEGQSNRALSDLFIRIGRIQYIILGAVLIGYMLYGPFFIKKWAGDEYGESYLVGAIIMIPSMIPLIQNIGIEIQRAKNKHKFRSLAYFFIAILNLLCSIPLAIKFGAVGSAVGTGFATIAGNVILMNWYYQEKIHLDIPRFFRNMAGPSLAMLAAGAEGILISYFFKVNSWVSFCIQGTAFVVVYFVCLYGFGFNEDEKEQVNLIIKRFCRKK